MSEWKEYTGTPEQIAEMHNNITQEYLKQRLNYDPETGVFTWISKDHVNSRTLIGSVAGTIKPDRCGINYLRIYLKGKRYYAQRLAWLYMTGEFPEFEVDHIDGEGLNNKWINLREVDRINNSRNRKLINKNTSGTCGVFFCNTKQRWTAQIGIEGKRKHVGYFAKLEDAIQARKNAETKHGFHGNHGQLR